MPRKLFFIFLIIMSVAYCATPVVRKTILAESLGATRVEAEGWYRILHNDMEECLNEERSYDLIEWYLVPPGHMMPNGIGMWSRPNSIYIDADYIVNAFVIRHELGHYIVQIGDSIHADSTFISCVNG